MLEPLLMALGPWRSPLLAFAVALGTALAARPRPALAGVAAGAGLAAGLFDVFGAMLITPRMLPERLPWLALVAALIGAALDLAPLGRRLRGAVLVAGAGAAAWWMLGAPRTPADLAAVAGAAGPVAVVFLVALAPWRGEPDRRPALRALLAAIALASGLRAAGAPMLFVGLSACVGGAALGTLAGTAGRKAVRIGDAGHGPLAAVLAGTAAAAALAWPGAGVAAAGAAAALVLAAPWPWRGGAG